ncbi:MAG: hypothetical protein GDA48_12075 [Hormoscilla sp. GM102CHS1]|nr:hypothetical protein [Hormoscilla sp. GM102CHS1]
MIAVLKQPIDKYHHLGIVKAGELLLRPADAINLADELEQMGILILGVDLWYDLGREIAEDPDSLDLSQVTDVKNNVAIARDFIANKLPSRITFVSLVWE